MTKFSIDLLHFPAPAGAICSMGWEAGSYGAPTWDAFTNVTLGQNKRFYLPFVLNRRVLVQGLGWYNGNTVAGNLDASIYDDVGNLLLDTGSTAQGSANVSQVVNTSDLELLPGNYFLSVSSDSTTAQLKAINMSAVVEEALGCKEQASAFTAPNPATFAAPSTQCYPWLTAFIRSAF